jgi:hypothetical protein
LLLLWAVLPGGLMAYGLGYRRREGVQMCEKYL